MKRKLKKSILRHPDVEYSSEKSEQKVDIDNDGSVHEEVAVESLIPEYPSACRCKDHIDIREIIAFEEVKGLLERGKSKRSIKWLDLCCGKGNILNHIKPTLGTSCSRVIYNGLDIDITHIEACRNIVVEHALDNCLKKPIDLSVQDLAKPFELKDKFDIVTILNVLHEIPPYDIYKLLKNAFKVCNYNGSVLIIDMCKLPHLEWKAITWNKDLLSELLTPILNKDNEMITTLHEIAIYRRKVEIFSAKLQKRRIDSDFFKKQWNKSRITKYNRYVTSCLIKKRKELSNGIANIYKDTRVAQKIDSKKNTSYNQQLKALLWEHWTVTEALNDYL